MVLSVAAQKTETSSDNPRLLSDTTTSVSAATVIANEPAKEAAKTISLEYTENTFLAGRKADFFNGDLSREVSIKCRQSNDEQIELSAGDYRFNFRKEGDGTPKTIVSCKNGGKDILKAPARKGVDGQEYIRKYMLALIHRVAKDDRSRLSEEIRARLFHIDKIYTDPLSTVECFSVPDGEKQRCVTYTHFANKDKCIFTILIPRGYDEPLVYLAIRAEKADDGNTLLFRYAPVYPPAMRQSKTISIMKKQAHISLP